MSNTDKRAAIKAARKMNNGRRWELAKAFEDAQAKVQARNAARAKGKK